MRSSHILFVDLELTCGFETEVNGRNLAEIIEIGIVEVSTKDLTVTRMESYLIDPIRSVVTPFCEALTGLTAKKLSEEGSSFPKVCKKLRKQWGSQTKTWMAWGEDAQELQKECKIHNVPYPMSQDHFNFSAMYSQMTGDSQRVSLDRALEEMGIEFEGERHRAMWDALATARIYLEFCKRVRGTR